MRPPSRPQTGRGWQFDKNARDPQIDAAVALAIGVKRAQHTPDRLQLLAWA